MAWAQLATLLVLTAWVIGFSLLLVRPRRPARHPGSPTKEQIAAAMAAMTEDELADLGGLVFEERRARAEL
jgi:hypothetical protein